MAVRPAISSAARKRLAGAPDAFSSIVKAQCASTFLPPDLAVTKTVQLLSRKRCVT